MNCPSCGAPIMLRPETEGYKCEYCHGVFFPGGEDDSVQTSNDPSDPIVDCPLCRAPLVKATVAKVPALFCKECHGLLLPMPVLEDVIEELRNGHSAPAVQTPPDRGDLKRAIRCPRCNQRMDTHFYAGPGNVIVDSCDGCLLLWLDRGELARIAHAPDESEAGDSLRF